MTRDEARALLVAMIQADADPALDTDDVDRLVDRARRVDPAGNRPANVATAASWAAAHSYVAGDVITDGERWWRCDVAGTSGTIEPAWPDLGGYPVTGVTVLDDDVVWVDNGGAWAETWDLRAAAHDGWLLKAAKCAGRVDFTDEGAQFRRSQIHAMCLEMADRYRRRGAGSVTIASTSC